MSAAASTASAAVGSAEPQRRDWRVWFGLAATALWIFLGIEYIGGVVGWKAFANQPAEALGGFLEGAFAPLAFLWLVIGFFLQQRELSQNTEAIRGQYEQMRRAAEHAEIQARAISANELHQRQETFLMVADRVSHQLGVSAGLLFMSSQSVGDEPNFDREVVSEFWRRLGLGDPEIFSRQLMALHYSLKADGLSDHDIYWDTEIRTRHSNNFLNVFERMIRSAEGCDPDGIIGDAILGSGHGQLFQIIQKSREARAAEA
jgi:hypothetical protein